MTERSSKTILTSHSEPNNTFPIGVFDSGIGGLSITSEIIAALPNEDIIYLSDNLYAPYGEQTASFLNKRIIEIADFFLANNAKAIVVACNTATVNAIATLRQYVEIPVIGVEPAIKPAAISSSNKKVGILVTRATATNQHFLSLIEKYKNGAQVFVQPCPHLVNHIEHGDLNAGELRQLLTEYLTPLIQANVDTLVLGCTHYPFVSDLIEDITKGQIHIMDTAKPVTEQLIRKLQEHVLLKASNEKGELSIFSSQPKSRHKKIIANLITKEFSLNTF